MACGMRSSVSMPSRYRRIPLLLHAWLLSFLSEIEVSSVDVDLLDDEAGHPADAIHDVLAHRIGDLRNIDPVIDGHIQVYRSLALPHLNTHAGSSLVAPSKPSGE